MNKRIIIGGMGVAVSNKDLAQEGAKSPDVLSTVSGVASWFVVSRILQLGDVGGHFRRALAHFPFAGVADRIVSKYYVDGGIAQGEQFKPVPAFHLNPSPDLVELTVASTFAIVWLAKEDHSALISINLLEKMQCMLLAQLYGAMLAGVHVVTMGAGIPMMVPGVLDAYAKGEPAVYRVVVEGSSLGYIEVHFDPRRYFGDKLPRLTRPLFLPIVSSHVLAMAMDARLGDGIYGFVVEKKCAGGHNASPRGQLVLNPRGEPVYGVRDVPNLQKIRDLGRPFWIGGSLASPAGLREAQDLGATGIQVGSMFALSDNSGILSQYRNEIRRLGFRGELEVLSDPNASPTGFPFQVVQLPGTLSDAKVYEDRPRVCDLCALSVAYQRPDGEIGFRCRAQPVSDYGRLGGRAEDTIGARCLCNGLTATVGLGSPGESAIVTLGKDHAYLRQLMTHERGSYTASDAIGYLLSG